MKLLAFADVHVHPYASQDVNGSRLNNCLAAISAAFVLADLHKCRALLFSGDLYDRGKALPAIVVNKVLETLDHCFTMYPKLNLYGVSGNHDQQAYNLVGTPSPTALSHLHDIFTGRFYLIDDQSVDDLGDVHIHGVPYYVSSTDARARIQARSLGMDRSVQNVLLCHQHHPGCEFGSDFELVDVEMFDYVFCGHIHQHRRFDARPFFSVGAPLPRDLADLGDPKGYLLVDTDTRDVTRLLTDFPYIERQVGRPRKDSKTAPVSRTSLLATSQAETQVPELPILTPAEMLRSYVNEKGLSSDYLTVGLQCLSTT